jgi:hypothetical protein
MTEGARDGPTTRPNAAGDPGGAMVGAGGGSSVSDGDVVRLGLAGEPDGSGDTINGRVADHRGRYRGWQGVGRPR